MVSWIAYLVAWNEMPSVFAANLAAAAVATVYAETMARILKTPVTVFLITGIIPVQCPYFPFILPIFGSLLYLRKPFQLCQAMAFIFFIWTKDNLDRNRRCCGDYDSIIDLWDLCIGVEVL